MILLEFLRNPQGPKEPNLRKPIHAMISMPERRTKTETYEAGASHSSSLRFASKLQILKPGTSILGLEQHKMVSIWLFVVMSFVFQQGMCVRLSKTGNFMGIRGAVLCQRPHESPSNLTTYHMRISNVEPGAPWSCSSC